MDGWGFAKDMMGKSAGSQVPADKVEGVKRLKQSTHLNMAACYLKVQDDSWGNILYIYIYIYMYIYIYIYHTSIK